KHPHRFPIRTRDAWKETGKRPRLLVVTDHKRIVFEIKKRRHSGGYCIRNNSRRRDTLESYFLCNFNVNLRVFSFWNRESWRRGGWRLSRANESPEGSG